MKALTVIPLQPSSAAVVELPEPELADGAVLVQCVAVGICGTDREILKGDYGAAPAGQTRLVLGHESIGRVLEAPDDGVLSKGDWVVGIVRRPDPVPCLHCAVGEWDMCENGKYTEHGIKGLHGFARERYRLAPDALVQVDASLGLLGVLIEPTSVVAKAWDQIERIGHRARFAPRSALVLGAGPIGLLAALLGVQRGLTVRVFDKATEGPKPDLVRALGASYHTGELKELCRDADITLECTGAPPLIIDAIEGAGPNAILCLTGVSSGGRTLPIDIGAINRDLVLENNAIFGSVNANRHHYDLAARALAQADHAWLERLITRRVAIEHWQEALARQPLDVKTVLTFPGKAA